MILVQWIHLFAYSTAFVVLLAVLGYISDWFEKRAEQRSDLDFEEIRNLTALKKIQRPELGRKVW